MQYSLAVFCCLLCDDLHTMQIEVFNDVSRTDSWKNPEYGRDNYHIWYIIKSILNAVFQ